MTPLVDKAGGRDYIPTAGRGSKPVPISGKEMVRRYRQHGWELDRINGSHFIMVRGERTVAIPVHGNRSLKRGLESRLLKDMIR